MNIDLLTPTNLLASGAAAVLVYAMLSHALHHDQKLHVKGSRPRKIHTLDKRQAVLGDLLERIANGPRVFDWILEHSLEFNGEPWRVTVPGQPELIMVTMPEAIEEVTITQFDNFPKGKFKLEYAVDYFGRGLVASDGERWSHQRKASVRFFSAKTLRTVMKHSMQKNMDKVYKVIDQAPDHVVDLKQLFLEFTIDTFSELGMGVELNCIGSDTPHPFQHAMDVVAPIISRRLRLPMWFWKAERWLNVGQEAELATQMRIVHKWLDDTIQQSFKTIQEKRKNQQDVIDEEDEKTKSVIELFLEHGHEDTEGLQPSDLKDFLLTFVIGARDTTAGTLSWLIYSLSKHPEVEKKIRDEMKTKLGDLEGTTFLTTDHTKLLTYLEATLKETLRLYPAAPFTSRQALKDTVLCGDIVVRKDELVGFSAYAMARHPRVWGPDAAEFKPERWIDEATGQILQVPATKFFTFSAGPRACIGMSLAMLELRIVAANLLHKYRFDVDPSNDGSYEVAPTLNMKYPLMAKATRVV